MFLFSKSNDKKKYKRRYPSVCTIELFGVKYKIQFSAVEATDDTSYDIIMNEYNYFMSAQVQEQIQAVLKKYIEENYFDIIEFHYIGIDIASIPPSRKERSEYSAVLKDYEDGSKNAMEIVLKNLKPVNFSVYGRNESYLSLYVNDADEYGLNVTVTPKMKVFYPDWGELDDEN
ncbi:MAG: hypothetical protein J1F04_06960 [Oscillospiraceae bacterium]|nr:hypothetical protein [Oscillospiraceae bacterium]